MKIAHAICWLFGCDEWTGNPPGRYCARCLCDDETNVLEGGPLSRMDSDALAALYIGAAFAFIIAVIIALAFSCDTAAYVGVGLALVWYHTFRALLKRL